MDKNYVGPGLNIFGMNKFWILLKKMGVFLQNWVFLKKRDQFLLFTYTSYSIIYKSLFPSNFVFFCN